ncbi:MAG: hypothetical protein E2O39_02695, partial [Planctomycetota bacterium]
MTDDEEDREAEHSVDSVFADYVTRVEAGEELDFESFVERHTELESGLRELHGAWVRVRDVLDRLGLSAALSRTRAEGESPAGSRAEVTDGAEDDEPDSDFAANILERLATHQTSSGRYQFKGEVARGGMGVVYRVWDEELRRHLAMKVILGKGDAKSHGDTPAADARAVARFLEEAQVTGQLNHPGIVPLHELGVDTDGRVYFTMSLVKGQSFSDVLSLVAAGSEDWPRTRALACLLRVCETMAYAHTKGVVHRDLKPSNVLVGPFGATYVIDWGLARVLGQPDRKDIRLAGEPDDSVSVVQTERRGSTTHRPESPLVTQDGDVVGTPSYMAPEQARGEVEKIGPPADVYSVGAMLYQLLAGIAPYTRAGTRHSPHGIWRFVLDGPPRPIGELARNQPPELVAICEKAMAREAPARYADMREMATDLRAYLEHRVVLAYRTGPLVELRKWVARNKLAAAALAVVVLVATASGFAVAWFERQRAREIQMSSDVGRTSELLTEARDLGPIHPENAGRFASWLHQGEPLLQRRDEYRARLARVVARSTGSERHADPNFHAETGRWRALAKVLEERDIAIPRKLELISDTALSPAVRARAQSDLEFLESDTPRLASEVELLEAEVERRELTRSFETEDDRLLYERLEELVHMLEELKAQQQRVNRDLVLAKELARLTIGEQSEPWERAIREVRASEVYGGLELVPQIGLVPLDANEQGLWEFWHTLSGDRPTRDENGRLVIEDATGMVFVLIPAGASWMGAQTDPAEHNHDPRAQANERPIQLIALDAFFMSKYEMTQGQWLRATGSNPSERFAGSDWAGYGTVRWTHPVERVSWMEASRVLDRYGLRLPTEAQWERTARAGSESPYVYGASPSALEGRDNLHVPGDGHPFHAPVDAFPPNALGVCSILGNVREWCLEWYALSYARARPRPGDGALEADYPFHKPTRGGSFGDRPSSVRVA